jgi:large subunit ribosomal protein L2
VVGKSLESLRSSLPTDLQRSLRSDLSVKQLSNAVKMVSKGLSVLPAYWFAAGKNSSTSNATATPPPPTTTTTLPHPGTLKGWSVPLRKTGGRNHHGKITVRHRGGGFKRRIRLLDTHRKDDVMGVESWKVERIEHDPNRSGKIALLRGTESGGLRYILATERMETGSIICNKSSNSNNNSTSDGACLALKEIPLGSQIHSIESSPGRGGQLVRAAGTCATLVGKDLDGIRGSVRLPSGAIKKLLLTCRAVLGRVSNGDWQNRVIGKAGRSRNLGRRPTVRGVAMNAVDHPHGGGKGGRSKGKPTQSIWGWTCK